MRNLWGERAKILESDVMKELVHYLSTRRVFFWRNNSGAYKDEERFVRYGFKGSPDFLAVFPGDKNGQGKGRLWCIEAKKPGGKLSDSQLGFLARAKEAGAVITVAESSFDVDKQLERWDAPCSERYQAAFDKRTK